MQNILFILNKVLYILNLKIRLLYSTWATNYIMYINNVRHQKITALGVPLLRISKGADVSIGSLLYIRSMCTNTDTGENRPCKLIVKSGAKLIIGKNVGISSSTIACYNSITIGENVRIGGGCFIFDTNFHPINAAKRLAPQTANMGDTKPVLIENNVFIGTACIIGKGVVIGENSVIAAGSVVVKNVPPNEIWGGNPAKYIKSIS